MNIGIDIRSLMSPTRSGIGEYTHRLLTALFELKTEHQFFLFYNSFKKNVALKLPWQDSAIHYTHTAWPNKIFNASTKFLHFPRIDSILTHTTDSLDIFFSPNFNFTALSKKTKHIITVHDISFEFFPEFFSPKQRLWHAAINPKKQCTQADILLTPSKNTKQDLVNIYNIPPEKITVMYPGIPPHIIPTSEHNSVEQKYNLPAYFILYLGTIEPRKNITGLIQAFEKAHTISPDLPALVIAGHTGWNDKEIYQKIYSSPIKEKIHYIGSVPDHDKQALYTRASLFIYPSFYEGFGFPVIEAMQYGVPVITSNRSSLPEITEGAAYLTNPNRPDELAEAMLTILKNPTIRHYFMEKGIQQAKKFNWQTTATEFLSTCTRIHSLN